MSNAKSMLVGNELRQERHGKEGGGYGPGRARHLNHAAPDGAWNICWGGVFYKHGVPNGAFRRLIPPKTMENQLAWPKVTDHRHLQNLDQAPTPGGIRRECPRAGPTQPGWQTVAGVSPMGVGPHGRHSGV
jgi:hypothetical protein